MQKKQVFMLVNLLVMSITLSAANTKITKDISVNDQGIISVGKLKFMIVHFAPGWKYSNQSGSCKKLETKKEQGSLDIQGKYSASSGVFGVQETITVQKPGSIAVHYNLTSWKGIPTNSLVVSLNLPIDLYEGRNLEIDGQSVLLPKELTTQHVKSPNKASKIIIPTNIGRLEITGKELGLYIQDNREFKGNSFDIRLNFQGVEKNVKDAHLQFKITSADYPVDPLDIAKVANMGFADEKDGDQKGGWTDQGSKNDLRQMKFGKQKFGSVTFNIINPHKNDGKSSLIFAGPGRKYFLKEAVIPVPGKKYRNLYLLHASAWTPKAGEKIGDIIAEYQDGTKRSLSVISKVDCGDWWNAASLKNGVVVWTAENKSSYIGLFLSKYKLENKPLKSITLKGSGKAVWMVAGASASSADIPLPKESPYYIVAGAEWAPFTSSQDILPGSIFDFSGSVDFPAGKYGHVTTTSEGHFSFSKVPGKRLKLIGGNLCFSANFLEKANADLLAKRFKMMGWNTVRFHHYDRDLVGGWNSKLSYNVDPKKLDRLDYMFAAMKKAGMYITIDLYTIREFGPDEIPEIKGPVGRSIKGLVPVLPSAFKAWTNMVEKLMNHVNPYTGMTWKDDPAFYALCPLNEDTITSVWKSTPQVREIYEKKYDEWCQGKGLDPAAGITKDEQFNEFLIETKMRSNREIEAFFKKLGVKALITGSNYVSSLPQAFMRSEFDFVDNHTYWDHPSFPEKKWSLPFGFSQKSVLKHLAGVPRELMPSRIFGKPFTVTEYNYCPPNKYRAEGGPVMGAYAALQDWDGLYRFAWSHNSRNTVTVKNIAGFDIATDPLNILGEKIISLLFVRGDVNPSAKKIIYAVTMKEACIKGGGWGKGFSSEFSTIGLVSQIGSQAIYDKHPKLTGKFHLAVAAENPGSAALNGIPFATPEEANKKFISQPEVISSDTGQIEINKNKGSFKVVTPKTECFVIPQGQNMQGKALSIKNMSTFGTLAASAMDGNALCASKKVLLLHLTDVANTKMLFRNKSRSLLDKWGELPHLVRKGKVQVELKNSNPDLKLWAIDMTGKRIDKVPVKYIGSKYVFTAETAPKGKTSRMAYELAK